MISRRFNCSYPSVSSGNWIQDPLLIPKPSDAQLPYLKRPRTMHAVGPPHPRIPNCGSRILFQFVDEKPRNKVGRLHIYWKKNLHINRPEQFKPRLFKGKMCFFSEKWRSQSSLYHIQLKHHKDIHQNVNNNNNLHIFSAYYVPGRLK